jgi:hypothetical protein
MNVPYLTYCMNEIINVGMKLKKIKYIKRMAAATKPSEVHTIIPVSKLFCQKKSLSSYFHQI